MNLDYLAGFIDADGCVTVGQGTITIRACNNNLPLLKQMQNSFGGKLAMASPNRGVYNVRWYGEEAIALADLIEDKLVLKKEEIRIMRLYYATRSVRGRHVTSGIKDYRKELEDTMKTARQFRLQGRMIDGKFVKESDLIARGITA